MNRRRALRALVAPALVLCAAALPATASAASNDGTPPDPGLGISRICNQSNSVGSVYWSNNDTAAKYILPKGSCTGWTVWSITAFPGYCDQVYQNSYPLYVVKGATRIIGQSQSLTQQVRSYFC